jgi:hypothetical protein
VPDASDAATTEASVKTHSLCEENSSLEDALGLAVGQTRHRHRDSSPDGGIVQVTAHVNLAARIRSRRILRLPVLRRPHDLASSVPKRS